MSRRFSLKKLRSAIVSSAEQPADGVGCGRVGDVGHDLGHGRLAEAVDRAHDLTLAAAELVFMELTLLAGRHVHLRVRNGSWARR